MSNIEDESEEILIDDNKLTLYHLERYLWQRMERSKNGKQNSLDWFLGLLSEFVISQDAEMKDADTATRRIMLDNRKLRDDIRMLGHRLIELDKKITPVEKEPMPRPEQFAKERCQAVARYLWQMHPTMTIAEVAEHEAVFNLGITKGKHYKPETVRKWVAEVDPRPAEKKIGRPPKAKK